MDALDADLGLACRSCGTAVPVDASIPRCPECGGNLRVTVEQSRGGFERAAGAPASMWAFDELLGLGAETAVSLGEGGTPLVESGQLATELGVSRFQIKDEGQNPTGTTADRGIALAITVAAELGVEAVSLAAPGAAGQSVAAYAARAGLDATVFLPSRAPFERKAMVNVHGGDLTVVQGRLPEAIQAMLAAREERDLGRPFGPFETPFREVGGRTLAYEIIAQQERPDVIAVPVGTGLTFVGLFEGFRDLRDLGVINSLPRLVAVQPSGCAPVVEAVSTGQSIQPPATPDTVCGELEVPDPPSGEWAIEAIEATDGAVVAVEDEHLLEAGLEIAGTAGIEPSPAGGAALAGVRELAEARDLDSGDSVLAVNPGTGGADLFRSRLEARPR